MVNEVEDILSEIRQRVEHEQDTAATSLRVEVAAPPARAAEGVPENTEAQNRLAAHLTTTARAWDRLPPMVSNRRGGAARFELWVKARFKSMARWFTWEQVNFNSAVHHALSEILSALAAYEQELSTLRAELDQETAARRDQYERTNRELTALRASFEAQSAATRKDKADMEARSAAIEARSAAVETRAAEMANEMSAARAEMAVELTTKLDWAHAEINTARTETTSQLAELAGELRQSDEQLREEQRVCFKQLSLETSEAAVMVDRARRLMEERVEKLEKEMSNGDG